MTRSSIPQVPRHLGKAGRAWLKRIFAEFSFDGTGEVELAVQAAECLDRIAECRALIAEKGMVVETAGKKASLKPNPATGAMRDYKTLFARLIRELRLAEPAKEEPRLPRIAVSTYRKTGA